uniref:Uncharacterized protein n=1 Tax=Candidatus Kentrum sp. FM TaxID=2126340 RepID=A0A450SCJ5_9GAMM|nr:MAG: hypothetical protein BECKFM1743A_GA0114220_100178 [Candidatus Kentron sp. FM]VFJ50144.1 MAG: hypothetical protein BECKFM1743C_GA0114222_100812 [Candidatus Kentron sp. FM]VFK06590.1 MAG: hypothetical protein BECKFM1743B_GA0114221_1002010 [Candidatus Kentron sp. FM]
MSEQNPTNETKVNGAGKQHDGIDPCCHQVAPDVFREHVVAQGDRFGDVGKELLKIELIVPSVYYITTVSKGMEVGVDSSGVPFFLAAGFWVVAILFTVLGIFPMFHQLGVNPAHITDDRLHKLFRERAERTHRWLVSATFAFVIGVVCAGVAVGFSDAKNQGGTGPDKQGAVQTTQNE